MAREPRQLDLRPDASLTQLLDEFFNRRRCEPELTPERFAAEHPEHAERLQQHLAGLPLIEQACSPGSTDDATPPAALPDVPGYTLLAEIGRGGMGVVYRALQKSTKRTVALKVMLAGPFASSAGRRRFGREVELAARLSHPHIVSVLESGFVAGQQYYAMEFVEGVRLDRCLGPGKERRRTLELFVQICAAVQYAHDHRIVHRDLKPANVLVDPDGVPHILDFGLAKAMDETASEASRTARLSMTGEVLGTLTYLSPEQAAGNTEQVDVRTDVYSLGVMLYEALTGVLPYDTGGRPTDVIRRIQEATPLRPSAVERGIGRELETVLLRALEKEPVLRYATVGELGDDLRRYLAGEPLHARPPSHIYRLRKRLSRHRLAVGLVSVTVLACVVAWVAVGAARRRDLADARVAILMQLQSLETGAAFSVGPAEALCRRYPRLPDARLLYAHTYFHNPNTRNSVIPFLEGELRRDPTQYACRALLADVYDAAGATDHGRRVRSEAPRDPPDTAEAWYLRSLATLNPTTALAYAREATQRDAGHRLAWMRTAQLALRGGHHDDAFNGAARLIELGERPFDWILLQGHARARQGRYRDALEIYTRAVDLHPSSDRPYVFRGHIWRRLHDHARAVDEYTRAIALQARDKSDVWTCYQRATPLWILGRAEEALEDYRRVRVMLGRPFYADARAVIILRDLGRQDEAGEMLQAALRDSTDNWLRAVLRCLAGELPPENLIREAVGDEQRCEAYYYAGEVERLGGRIEPARQYFEQAVGTGVMLDLDTLPFTPMSEYELAEWRLGQLASPSQ